MKKMIGLILVAFASTTAFAANDCASMAAEKKLAGAAKTSFMKKCEADAMPPAQAACEATASGIPRRAPIHQVAITPQASACSAGMSLAKSRGCATVKYSRHTCAVIMSCTIP